MPNAATEKTPAQVDPIPAPVGREAITKVQRTDGRGDDPTTLPDALARMTEAEDTLRAIGAGEVDAFVLSDGGPVQQVFTLSTADRPYRMFVENMRDGAATISPSGLILYANRRLAELLECPRETIVGSPLAMFVAGGARTGLGEIRWADALGATVESELMSIDGGIVPVLVGASLLEVDGDSLICLTFTDLTAQKTQDREIARLSQAQSEQLTELQVAQVALIEQATHDALTGLPNRALLVDRIDQALARSKRFGRCTAVLFVDLDRFKHVNDTKGHAAGDAVLRRVAEQLVEVLRPMDTVARIGGDEFVVLAPDVDDHLHAVDIGARIVAELCRPSDGIGGLYRPTASIGLAVSVGGRGTAETLLKEADTAMYKAKSLGGGRVDVFDADLGRQVRLRADAQLMLRSALDDHRIVVHYQPVVNLGTDRVVGFEALARITGEDGAILLPAIFIPVAEETGLVVPLGGQVLDMACKEACGWQPVDQTGNPVAVAVNVSARQLEHGDLMAVVTAKLERTGLDPTCLHLELTETAIIDLRPDTLEQLGRIRDLGVQIGLDDFGTGYASLSHLRRLPLTFVKIDQSFVQGLQTDDGDDRIVSAVVGLAAHLGLRSIAEGVETAQQLDRLREVGCDEAQGYFFAKPLPPTDIRLATTDPTR
jgi:diguanylate cyclase (GGDEF)-like protein/PAS domain S-box-containing protein